MKGILCYYSGTGNTLAACRYMVKNLSSIDFVLYNIAKGGPVDFTEYDLAGFAAFADFWGPSMLFRRFIKSLPRQKKKPAFLFNTFGSINGRTLMAMAGIVKKRGFDIIAEFALHTPENFPVMVAGDNSNSQAPDEREMNDFNNFINYLSNLIDSIKTGKDIKRFPTRTKWPDIIIPSLPRRLARKISMGRKFLDEKLCNECGVCAQACPYQAIKLDPKPIFNSDKCWGCWACYNRCLMKAIYTKNIRGTGHYPGPIEPLLKKLKV